MASVSRKALSVATSPTKNSRPAFSATKLNNQQTLVTNKAASYAAKFTIRGSKSGTKYK